MSNIKDNDAVYGEFYAHSLENNPDKSLWHRLNDHLKETAILAGEFASGWGAKDWAYLAGLLHDVGKYSKEFQQKISIECGENAHIESLSKVDHSTAGAQYAVKQFGKAGKILAYTIAGHHGGLPDGISSESCLKSRLGKKIPDWSGCPLEEIPKSSPTLPFTFLKQRAAFQFSVFIRMIFSCLVDADFLNTEKFIDADKAASRYGYKSLIELENIFFENLSLIRNNSLQTKVNENRELVLNQCLESALNDMGFFSLTVPTGGGKTLSSMAFALKHANKHNLKRIIYVIPFTSIIEQNAEVFRDMFGDNAVLEHHSNYEPSEEDHRSRLASENWDAPIVVTTNVQFFESLYANRTSQCRKLHNIAESIVILDEVQNIPAQYLLPCLEALTELKENYKVSIVLCSATQPAVQKRTDFLKGLEGVKEIIKNPQQLYKDLKRIDTKLLGSTSIDDLAEKIKEYRQVLCVVNTRNAAQCLYKKLLGSEGLYHLSALMCPVHRSQKLAEIHKRLKEQKACVVISTQLVEAGVDIDFPVVFRSLSGIDSIAQAAGRCNREGKLDKGQVYVFTPEEGIPSGPFRQTAQAAESVIRRYPDDILSLDAIEEYFKLYYWTKGDKLDEEGILESLQEGLKDVDFPFKTISEKFKLIKDFKKPVIIPFNDEARKLISSIDSPHNPAKLSREFQKYTVSIPLWQWDNLFNIGSIKLKSNLFPILVDEMLYKPDIGLCADDPSKREPDELYI